MQGERGRESHKVLGSASKKGGIVVLRGKGKKGYVNVDRAPLDCRPVAAHTNKLINRFNF